MPTEAIQRLEFLCNILPPLLNKLEEKDFSFKPNPEKWSKKEILGHLIDSATNNHQRFIRAQFQEVPTIVYDQNNWNKYSHYSNMDSKHVISFWEIYNRHLLKIVKAIPSENLERECQTESRVTLEWLIDDYVKHLEHHLRQILDY